VQVVSWPLVKKLAEPDAGLPGHTVTLQSAKDHSLIAEKTTDASGILVSTFPPEGTSCSASATKPKL